LPCGAKAIEFEHVFGSNIVKKTTYPSMWSCEKIMQANLEAFQNQIYINEFLRSCMKRMHIVGISKDGLKIEMLITELSDGKLVLETCYPYFEKYSKIKGL